jgi:hypothetical protein
MILRLQQLWGDPENGIFFNDFKAPVTCLAHTLELSGLATLKTCCRLQTYLDFDADK